MINLRIPPKNPEELYEFFKGIANSPVKSHVAYVGMINYIREDWVVNLYLAKTNNYSFWFYYKESEPAKWYEVYDKFSSSEDVCLI